MKQNPHEPPQVPMTEQERRDQALVAHAHAESANAWRAAIDRAMGERDLRKWCIEQANVFCEHNEGIEQFALDDVARAILVFIGEPFIDAGLKLAEKKKPAD